ncbi:MAG: glycosyltransferase family 2 protein [Methylophaga sp.]|nr:glycosyltransferase family 2 protein [Methylophaga sp.]
MASDQSTCSPVALFVYNRPWHTEQAVKALQNNALAAETPLYIFSDASNGLKAKQAVDQVRKYIRTIDGFASVTIMEREKNYGLARSIIEGVTKLCEDYGRVIVLEDDLVTSPHFLSYMNNALYQYEKEERVMQIAGYMFPANLKIDDDALFMSFISSWGWATWQRAWEHLDPDAKGYKLLEKDPQLKNKFDLNGHYSYFKMLKAQQQGKTQSWAIRWYLSVFLKDGLVLYPEKTLVSNLGFDGSGVNCAVSTIEESQIEEDFHVKSLPRLIDISAAQNIVLAKMPSPQFSIVSIINRLLERLKQFFN